ncbi:glycerophosphodiester phosphodiesterase [Nonomuraea sp. M3C6]|uniref:Glycerophosphodiester phosphodiesterase n=1 Tax=Nonomuraea marmarensis TaxID=3351344 RepID=A0ABW7AID7_9ACTN
MFQRLALILATTLSLLAAPAAPADAETVANVAHRGASAYAPENTIASFRLASRLDADVFELDVQETKDHQLVVMHDSTLSRTTDAERVYPDRSPWNVRDLTLAEIRKLDAGSWFSSRYSGERVPTLSEALNAMKDSNLSLMLEVKGAKLYPGIEERVVAELRRNPSWLSERRLAVQSFNWDSMRKFHGLMSDVPIGLLGTPTAEQLPGLAEYADLINPPHKTLTAEYVERVHQAGMRVHTYTINNSQVMRRMIDFHVDGIITNKPDVLADLISA